MNGNLLIEASAGTGKTQALGMRLIELLRQGLKPQEIVALTFSRAAAGEIFERFVTLLAGFAEKNPADAALLREVIATQHLSQVGTLDSFLMRIVRAFPLEMGLAGEVELLGGYHTDRERDRVSFSILRRTDEKTKRAFVDAFSLAMNRENVRSFTESYRRFISSWHESVAMMPDASSWGEPAAIWGFDPQFAHVTATELAAAADAIEGLDGNPAWSGFTAWVREFRGRFSGVKGIAKKLLESEEVFAGDAVSFSFNRRQYSFGREDSQRIRTALMCVYGYVIRMKLELSGGIYRMISAYESEYAKKVRAAGRLVFSDIPRLISALPEGVRAALEYRMDSRIRAWALDEFQDTSREQWKVLSPLVDEALQSNGEKSVFIVGDTKQAIYGWRNGDVGIFTRERDSGAYEIGELKKTYRSGPAVIEAVNRVFTEGRIREEFPRWRSPRHETAREDLGGFVRVIDAPGRRKEDFVEPVYLALRAHARKDVSAAVLVRNNTFGEMLANGLKAMGLENVVWEGESDILDTPALTPFLDLMQLADHPGDMLTYRHFILTALCRAKYPQGAPDAGRISREMSSAFTARGIVRTLRELRSLLAESPEEAWSGFTEARFTDMLRAAAEFELSVAPGTRLADFARYLKSKKKRNVAEPGKIKIMTIHRSKGLGFDYVVLPFYEHGALNAESDGPLIGDGWILPDPGAKVAKAVGGLEEAYRLRKDRSEQEELCAYYVAMTRAKSAMTIILHPEGGALRFSDIVRNAGISEIGGNEVSVSKQKRCGVGEDVSAEGRRGAFAREPRRKLQRRLPSLAYSPGQPAGELFAAAGARRAALMRGQEAHAEYERIGWIASGEAQNDFEKALVKPAGTVQLWREQAFETLVDGVWTSGRFDRVVFTGEGEERRATVYDFKTNRRKRGESDEEFRIRMLGEYTAQMEIYRKSVSLLASIPLSRVSAVLLFPQLKTVIEVNGKM